MSALSTDRWRTQCPKLFQLMPAVVRGSIEPTAGYSNTTKSSNAGVSRSTFYARFLPRLESIRIGKRRLILLASLDELIERLRGLDAG